MLTTSAHRALVVEDEASIRVLLAELLEMEGFPVTTAAAGAAALRQVDALQPLQAHVCVVVMDLGLPKVDGLVVLQYLRAHAPGVPVVVVTAQAMRIPAALEAGAVRGLEKPFGIDDLLAVVRQHCPYERG
jgi:DNA-binding response OmpR family regulator